VVYIIIIIEKKNALIDKEFYNVSVCVVFVCVYIWEFFFVYSTKLYVSYVKIHKRNKLWRAPNCLWSSVEGIFSQAIS
jgi:hypothetical protein